MKKHIFIITLCLVAGYALAQTQTLPDLRITGESGVKAHLYKRSLLFSPLFDVSDSLPVFMPAGIPEQDEQANNKSLKHRCYLQLEGNTEIGASGFVSYYPASTRLNGVSHRMLLSMPDENRTSLQNLFSLGFEPFASFPVAFRTSYHRSKAKNFESGNLDLTLAHYHRSLPLGESSINDLAIQLGYNSIDQDNLIQSYDKSYIDYYLAAKLISGVVDSKVKVIGQAGETGIQIAPAIKWRPYGIENIRIHLLADAYHFIPSLEFSYRDPLSGGGVFRVVNLPRISSNSFSELLEDNPWQAFGLNHKLQKTPVDLTTGLEYTFHRKNDFSLIKLDVSDNLRYDSNTPIPMSGLNYGIRESGYSDLITNNIRAEALFRMEGFLLRQDLCINLAYLPRHSMKRAPYQPLVGINSRLSYPYKQWMFSSSIIQSYFSKDHQNNNLPESIVINASAEYTKGNSGVYGQLANILNQKQWVFSELPATGITLFIGMKHRF